MATDPFVRLAQVGGAVDPVACARAARALVAETLPADPFDAALRVKRILAARGFRDDASAFTLPDMLERRRGNCLGLTLLVSAVLLDRGHELEIAVRVDPLDDVHDAGAEYFARLHDPRRGIDADSRLPDARDRRASYRFAPVEHASIVLAGDRPFEATNLVDLEVPPGWAPVAESVRRVDFHTLAAAIYGERAKAGGSPALAVRAVREDRANREAWAETWYAAVARERPQLAAFAIAQHGALGGDDSLFWFTRYRMTGDEAALDRALDRLPAYAVAYLHKHVTLAAERGDDPDELRRRFAIVAWLVARSEILDLETLYRRHAMLVTELFGADELATLLASFARAPSGAPNSRT